MVQRLGGRTQRTVQIIWVGERLHELELCLSRERRDSTLMRGTGQWWTSSRTWNRKRSSSDDMCKSVCSLKYRDTR